MIISINFFSFPFTIFKKHEFEISNAAEYLVNIYLSRSAETEKLIMYTKIDL